MSEEPATRPPVPPARPTAGGADSGSREGGHTSGAARVPALDGLRGIAILLVVGLHAPVVVWPERMGFFPGGFLGVTLFFVLSGYLITDVLLRERARAGSLDRRAFYVRRLARLGPALLLFLLVCTALAAAGVLPSIQAGSSWADAWLSAVTLSTNWWTALGWQGIPLAAQMLWSLAIEEQFYLVWPTVLILVLVRPLRRSGASAGQVSGRALRVVLVAAIACMLLTVAGALLWGSSLLAYFATWVHLPALMMGAALALLTSRGRLVVPRITGAAVLLLPALWLFASDVPPGRGALTVLLASVLSAALLALVVSGQVPQIVDRGLRSGVLRWFGQRSYALYLWNPVAFAVVAPLLGSSRLLGSLVGIAAACAAAEVSWRTVERPVNRFAHQRFTR